MAIACINDATFVVGSNQIVNAERKIEKMQNLKVFIAFIPSLFIIYA